MSRVLKTTLEVEARQLLYLPQGAQLLSVVVQTDERPHLYYLADEARPAEQRIIRTVSAGEEFNADSCRYIGTFSIAGWYVGHVFEQFEGHADVRSARYVEDRREVARQQLDITPEAA